MSDGRYGYRAWDRRPGDGVDPSPVLLDPEQTIFEVAVQAPMPAPATPPVTLTGRVRTQPTVYDVLQVAPTGGLLMNDTPTRQDTGMHPSGFNW